MPAQVVPIQDIASTGVIEDTPSIALPPNAFSDVSNVRFHDGAARKMEGERSINVFPVVGNIVHIAYWQGAMSNYYVLVEHRTSDDTLFIAVRDIIANTTTSSSISTLSHSDDAVWQHTSFNGGFNLIINNGIDTPHYLSEPLSNPIAIPLPNWDSYLAQEEVTTITWDEFNPEIDLGRTVDFTKENLLFTVTPRDQSEGIINYRLTSATVPLDAPLSLDVSDPDKYLVTPRTRTATETGALPGDSVSVSIETRASIQVRAGVVRTYGNLLIAGDLTEVEVDDPTQMVRRLPGTIRTSDVAAPGAIPLNWNPFRLGANTADEFILSSTGIVKDMVELQGVMYVYTDVSIHAIQQTGNPTVPFQISTTTDSYGANSIGSIIEVDGKHIVVGSDDVYIFAGHPGSIASIADGMVRHYIANLADLDITNIRMVRSRRFDELWIFTPELGVDDGPALDEMLVWNYRSPKWTKRKQTDVISGTEGPIHPVFATNRDLFEADVTDVYVKFNDNRGNDDPADDVDGRYESFIERDRLALTPEFDTETLSSTALMLTTDAANLEIRMRGSETPADSSGVTPAETRNFTFNHATDYKVDTRIHGRFLNYRITDEVDGEYQDAFWNLTGYQFEIMKGGKR